MNYKFQRKQYTFNNYELSFLQGKDQLVTFPLGDSWSNVKPYLGYIRNYFYIGTKKDYNEKKMKKKFIKNIVIVEQHDEINTTILLYYVDTEKEEVSTNFIKLSLPTLTLCIKDSRYKGVPLGSTGVHLNDILTSEKSVLSMFENERDNLTRDERILYGQLAAKRQTTERNALRF